VQASVLCWCIPHYWLCWSEAYP